ncbi:hypothetical protein D7Z26_20975 [Cohnella endophytica]|uniref:HTH araC/xylS-type domain-containing protein n=1 Tax=Cohnella endophytica TaxID=2419778 RepID=A0A494XDX7_9BACL|nr:hypothetical protein D7Z26_20975 [Cohnella endophytica]
MYGSAGMPRIPSSMQKSPPAHAREMLFTTDLPQERIAEYCVFADIHHFSNAFRSKSRMTLGQYRLSVSSEKNSSLANVGNKV